MTTLETTLGERLRAAGLTIATAESCTGGLVAARLTAVAGSSDYVVGGVVAYTNAVKQHVLGVDAHTLHAHSAVSAPVAQQMADGVRTLLHADIALSVTGYAGPASAPDQPAGLTYIGLSAAAGTWVRRFVWQGDRAQNRAQSVNAALQFVVDYLDGRL